MSGPNGYIEIVCRSTYENMCLFLSAKNYDETVYYVKRSSEPKFSIADAHISGLIKFVENLKIGSDIYKLRFFWSIN